MTYSSIVSETMQKGAVILKWEKLKYLVLLTDTLFTILKMTKALKKINKNKATSF